MTASPLSPAALLSPEKGSGSPANGKRFVLTLSCQDGPGIIAEISACLAGAGCNIVDSSQFGDTRTGLFFMRVAFDAPESCSLTDVRAALQPTADRFAMDQEIHDQSHKARIIVMVSKFDHCLLDLLYRQKVGALPVEIVAIVSNHHHSAATAALHDVPFRFWPVTPETKEEAEAKLLQLVEESRAELVVLARYMQILSPELAGALSGRAINIHHSFLPAFKGARPYQQAHERGVKLIGATAHYVTPDLDEGPIIEQDTERVNHAMSPADLAAIGRDVEAKVLARAVKAHVERRVFLNGVKTVILR